MPSRYEMSPQQLAQSERAMAENYRKQLEAPQIPPTQFDQEGLVNAEKQARESDKTQFADTLNSTFKNLLRPSEKTTHTVEQIPARDGLMTATILRHTVEADNWTLTEDEFVRPAFQGKKGDVILHKQTALVVETPDGRQKLTQTTHKYATTRRGMEQVWERGRFVEKSVAHVDEHDVHTYSLAANGKDVPFLPGDDKGDNAVLNSNARRLLNVIKNKKA